tara:strand:- start:361 stop:702 length:342 start_codon:yes stop_codon:yes gene_type:complete
MKIVDIIDSKIIKNEPEQTIVLISNGNIIQNGFRIKNLELRLYTDINPENKTRYSIITSCLQTDIHSIESKYEEGIDISLEKSAKVLIDGLGLSAMILRLVISLEDALKTNNE